MTRPVRFRIAAPAQIILLLFTLSLPAQIPSESPVDLNLENATLEDAMELAAAQVGAHLVYADALLKHVKISGRFQQEPFQDALKAMLAHTTISFKWTDSRRLVLFAVPDQEPRVISGTVYAANGPPLNGVSITIPGSGRTAVADGAGVFQFQDLPEGTVMLDVSAPGFQAQTLTVHTTEVQRPIQVELVQALHLQEHMEVSFTEGEPLSVSTFSGDTTLSPVEIAAVNASGRDLYAGLRQLPGASETPGEGGVGFRGGRPSENLMLVDGIKLYQQDHAMGHFSALNTDALSRARIFKGGFPAQYGDRVSGVLDFSTSGGPGQPREVKMGVNQDVASVTLHQPLGSQVAVMLSARRSVSDKTTSSVFDRVFQFTFNDESTLSEDDLVASGRNIRFEDFLGKLSWKINDQTQVAVTWFDGTDHLRESMDIPQFNQLQIYGKNGEWGNRGGSFRLERMWANHARTELTVTSTNYTSRFGHFEPYDWDELEELIEDSEPLDEAFAEYLLYNDLEEELIRLDHVWVLNAAHTLEMGLVSGRTQTHFQVQYFQELANWEKIRSNRQGFYIQDLWEINPKWRVLAGVRGEDLDQSGASFLDPRLQVRYARSDAFSMRAALGWYHQHILRSPDTLNYFEGVETWFLAGEDVKPGFAKHYQLGGRWEAGGWTLDAELYHKNKEGSVLRLFDPLAGDRDIQQTEDVMSGLDLFVQKRLGSFLIRGSYAWQRTRVKRNMGTGEALDHPTDRDRPHSLNLTVQYEKGPWQASAFWRYASGRPYATPQVVAVPLEDEEDDFDGDFEDFSFAFLEDDEEEEEEGEEFEDEEFEYELAPPDRLNQDRLPYTSQLDLGVWRNFKWRKVQARIGVTVLNVLDRENTIYRYFFEEEGDMEQVDVHDFGFKTYLDFQMKF